MVEKLKTRELSRLPMPSDDQIERFAVFVSDAYSWYKHLPLLEGGCFIIYLSPHAGANARLQWRKQWSTKDHLESFGHLDYMFRLRPTYLWRGDGSSPPPRLEDKLKGLGSVVLYPYVSSEFYWAPHEVDLKSILEVAPHPHAKRIQFAYEAYKNFEHLENSLNEEQGDRVSDIVDEIEENGFCPAYPEPYVKDYLRAKDEENKSMIPLCLGERKKLLQAASRVARYDYLD